MCNHKQAEVAVSMDNDFILSLILHRSDITTNLTSWLVFSIGDECKETACWHQLISIPALRWRGCAIQCSCGWWSPSSAWLQSQLYGNTQELSILHQTCHTSHVIQYLTLCYFVYRIDGLGDVTKAGDGFSTIATIIEDPSRSDSLLVMDQVGVQRCDLSFNCQSLTSWSTFWL